MRSLPCFRPTDAERFPYGMKNRSGTSPRGPGDTGRENDFADDTFYNESYSYCAGSVKAMPGSFSQGVSVEPFPGIGTGAFPSTGRLFEPAGNAMPPRREPPVEGAGEDPGSREAEQGGGPSPPLKPEEDLGGGPLAGGALPVRE